MQTEIDYHCLTLNEVHSDTRVTHGVATDIDHEFHLWVSIFGAPTLWTLRLIRCIIVVTHPDTENIRALRLMNVPLSEC